MRLKNLKLLFCLSLTGILPAAAQNAQFSSHISSSDIQAFAQDRDGYVWIGTSRGLNRYNGTNFATFYAASGPDALNSNNILSRTLDSSGRLWTGTECTFRKDDINTPVARYYAPGMSWNDKALVSAGGDLWIPRISGDSTYVDVLDKGLRLLEEFRLGQGLPVVALAERPAHTIWMATGRGIRCFDGRSRTQIPTPQPLAELVAGGQILFLLPYKENNLLLGLAGKGMYSYNTQAGSVVQVVPEQHLTAPEYICFVDRPTSPPERIHSWRGASPTWLSTAKVSCGCGLQTESAAWTPRRGESCGSVRSPWAAAA